MGVTASGFSGEPGPARLQGVYESIVGDSTAEPVRGHCTSPSFPGDFMYNESKTRCAGGASSTRRARPGLLHEFMGMSGHLGLRALWVVGNSCHDLHSADMQKEVN